MWLSGVVVVRKLGGLIFVMLNGWWDIRADALGKERGESSLALCVCSWLGVTSSYTITRGLNSTG